jgi:hypothetical protein
MLLIMLVVSPDYGISWDEKMHKEYGEQLLNYYLTLGTDNGYLNFTFCPIHLLGGFYDVTTVSLHKIANKIAIFDEYNFRHFFSALLGFLAILFTGLTSKELSGWRSGSIALFFIFLTPVFFGHSMYNPKDIPLAAFYIASIYFIVRFVKEIPNPKIHTVIFACISIGLSIGIRAGGLILIVYVSLLSTFKIIPFLIKKNNTSREKLSVMRKSIICVVVIIVTSYLLGLLFWPYGLSNPLKNPFFALKQLSNYYQHVTYELFEGQWITSTDFPWYYIPKWIWITTPLFITFSLFLFPVLFIKKLNQQSHTNFNYVLFVIFTAVFPITYIIIKKSNLYDSWRHLLFIYPSIAVIASLTWNNLIGITNKVFHKIVFFAVLLLCCIEPAVWMINNHPHQSFYFTPLIGGVDGAFKKYEIDYWGTSLRSAVEWIAAQELPPKDFPTIRIRTPYGEKTSSEHFINKYNHLSYVEAPEGSSDWDYSLILPAMAKDNPALLTYWPPQGTVHEIKVDNTPLVAIVKKNKTASYMQNSAQSTIRAAAENKTPEYYLALSLKHYQAGAYEKSIEAAREGIKLKPDYAPAYNNMCAAYNEMKMWDKGIESCRLALKSDPMFQLAKNNLKWALEKKQLMQKK